MSTTTQTVPRPTRQARMQKRFLRRRQRLAAILERALDARYPLKHGLQPWPRIPRANRSVVFEPLEQIASCSATPRSRFPSARSGAFWRSSHSHPPRRSGSTRRRPPSARVRSSTRFAGTRARPRPRGLTADHWFSNRSRLIRFALLVRIAGLERLRIARLLAPRAAGGSSSTGIGGEGRSQLLRSRAFMVGPRDWRGLPRACRGS